MRRRRRLALAGFTVASVLAALAAFAVTGPTASADVAGPYFANQDNASDPHIITCTHPQTRVDGYCLYTSQDMGQQHRYSGNDYPMEYTRAFWSVNGIDGWVSMGDVFREDWIEVGSHPKGFVPPNSYHLWAPSVVRIPHTDTYYLYVPDVADRSNDAAPNLHTSSRIAVAVSSTGPFGPFNYIDTVQNFGAYMSDPDVVVQTNNQGHVTDRHLVFANGDGSNCGGLSYVALNSDMRTYSTAIENLSINGVGVLGNCGGKGRPYLEGPSLYKMSLNGVNPWTLVFAAKPTVVPPGCSNQNEVIAWAAADSPNGPWNYQGVLMCGSTTEWTNQATITTANGRLMMVYHDGPSNKQRKLHAECLFSNSGIVAGMFRQPITAANGFNACMAGVNKEYKALWVTDPQVTNQPPLLTVVGGVDYLRALKYAVGPWERFKLESTGAGGVIVAMRAMSNGKLVCTGAAAEPLTPVCTSTTDPRARFVLVSTGQRPGEYKLYSIGAGAWVGMSAQGQLFPDSAAADAAIFLPLHPGGTTA